jgi:hypothetical protein
MTPIPTLTLSEEATAASPEIPTQHWGNSNPIFRQKPYSKPHDEPDSTSDRNLTEKPDPAADSKGRTYERFDASPTPCS